MTSRSVLLIICGLLLAGCRGAAPVQLTAADVGRHIGLRLGQEIEVRLEANPTTGYRWQMVHEAPAVLDFLVAETYAPAPSAPRAVGGGGTVTWRFRAARPGQDSLQLLYRRPWEADSAPARTFKCDITVQP
jgi:inhibitor of cysteine peptidase